MKKIILTAGALLLVLPLFAEGPTWDLSPIQSSLKTLVPVIIGIICLIALLGWMGHNLMTNWKQREEIFVTAFLAVVAIAVVCGIVYAGMRILLV